MSKNWFSTRFLYYLIVMAILWLPGCRRTFQINIAFETPELQPRLGKVAYITGGDLWVLDLDNGHSDRMTRDGYNSHPKWSADGRYLAFLKRKDIWVVEINSKQASRVFDFPSDWFAWSSRGLLAIFSQDNGLASWNSTDQTLEEQNPIPVYEFWGNFVWSTDGEALFFNRRSFKADQYQVSVEKLTIGQKSVFPLYASMDRNNTPRLASPSPDGRWLAFWRWDADTPFVEEDGLPLCILGMNSGKPNCLNAQTIPNLESLAWSSNGDLVLIAENPLAPNASLVFVSPETMVERTLIDLLGWQPLHPAWSYDGKFVAISARLTNQQSEIGGSMPEGFQDTNRQIWIVEVATGKRFSLVKDSRYSNELPLFAPDGEEILFARLGEQEASLWLIRKDGGNLRNVVPELTPLPEPEGEFGIVDWSSLWDWWRPANP